MKWFPIRAKVAIPPFGEKPLAANVFWPAPNCGDARALLSEGETGEPGKPGFAWRAAILFLVVATGGLLPVLGAEPDLEPLRKTIAALNERYLQTLKDGDAEAHAALFAEDGMILVPGVPNLVGRQQIFYDKRAKFKSVRVLDGTIHSTHLERSGNLAYEVGTFRYTFQSNGREPLTVTGKYLVIWKRQQDGSWKIQVDAGLPD